MMRFLLRVLMLGTLVGLPVLARGVEIVRVLEEYKTERDFQRISEFFTGKENTGGVFMWRSYSGERAGYYWTVRVKSEVEVPGARVELQVIDPGDARAVRKFFFEVDLPKGSRVMDIGVTGGDWRFDAKVKPVAWRLAVLNGEGKEVAVKESYLWAKPAGGK